MRWSVEILNDKIFFHSTFSLIFIRTYWTLFKCRYNSTLCLVAKYVLIFISFPLNRTWRFGRDVIGHSVDALHFVDNPCGGFAEEFM